MPLPEHIEQRGSLRYSAKKLCALCGKKISLFLDRDVVSENQIYLSFDMPLREHIEQRFTIGVQKK